MPTNALAPRSSSGQAQTQTTAAGNDASDILAALGNMNISGLKPQVKAEWKRIGEKIAPVLPRDVNGRIKLSNYGGEMEEILADLDRFRKRATDEDEKDLIRALEPVEKMMRKFLELFDEIDMYKDAYQVFKNKLDQV